MDNRGTGVQSPAERDEIFLFSETTRRVLMAGGGGEWRVKITIRLHLVTWLRRVELCLNSLTLSRGT